VDLGREWVEWTGLPCVFARWGVRRAADAADRRAFAQALEAALVRGLESIPEIAERRRDTGWGPAEITTYLRGFTYRLGPREDQAIAEFQRLRARLP